MWWPFKKKDKPEKFLRPGICECGHIRSIHKEGKGRCYAGYPPDKEWPNGGSCACQIFIRNEDNDNDQQPRTPTPSELERMLGIAR